MDLNGNKNCYKPVTVFLKDRKFLSRKITPSYISSDRLIGPIFFVLVMKVILS